MLCAWSLVLLGGPKVRFVRASANGAPLRFGSFAGTIVHGTRLEERKARAFQDAAALDDRQPSRIDRSFGAAMGQRSARTGRSDEESRVRKSRGHGREDRPVAAKSRLGAPGDIGRLQQSDFASRPLIPVGQPAELRLSSVMVSKSLALWRSRSWLAGSPKLRFTMRPRLTAGRSAISFAQRFRWV